MGGIAGTGAGDAIMTTVPNLARTEAISYSDDLWDAFVHAPAEQAAIAERLYEHYLATRDFGAIKNFVATELPAGRVMLVGAGTHTGFLLPLLDCAQGVEPVGVIDRNGDSLDSFFGLPVHTPECAAELMTECDYFLLSHSDRESEMTKALLAVGVPDDKILPIYGDKTFQDYSLEYIENHLDLSAVMEKDILIVMTGRARLVPERILATVLPPEKTVELYLGRPTEWDEGDVFQRVNLHQSLGALKWAIERLRPRMIYFCNTVQYSMPALPVFIRENWPSLKVVHETYDLGSFIEDERLKGIWGFDDESIRTARLSEVFSFRHGDYVVHKNVGHLWDAFERRCEAPIARYYPGVDPTGPDGVPPVSKRSDRGNATIVYPGRLRNYGSVVSPDVGDSLDILETMERVAAPGGIEFYVYNLSHGSEAEDRDFSFYPGYLADKPINYRRRVLYEDLMPTISQYDFGWLYFMELTTVKAENIWRVGIPNKFTDYVQAGLPVIVTDQFECVADLVVQYGAGIVVPSTQPEKVSEYIRAANWDDLRENTARLCTDMRQGNRQTLRGLTDILEGSAPI